MLQKTELEKQKSGEEFWNSDAELSAVKSAARALCDQYNLTTEDQKEERLRILKKLFGSCGDDIFIKPPFHCDYGYNLHVGKNFFANFDTVILDAAPVTIGDNCLIGPAMRYLYRCTSYGLRKTCGKLYARRTDYNWR
ncbi:MAG: maltose acetyltransferase domain-containing protein [Eubacterium sp.]